MSKSTYSVFERMDRRTGKWEAVDLYKKYNSAEPDGGPVYDLAQLLTGNSEYLSAIFGEMAFDYPTDEGDWGDECEELIEQIGDVIDSAITPVIPQNASDRTIEYYEKFAFSGYGGESAKKSYPRCVTYTLRDLDVLRLLAKSVTPKASRFYERYFAQIQWLLTAVTRMEYLFNSTDVRVIIWGD